jgi:hypothetical protein
MQTDCAVQLQGLQPGLFLRAGSDRTNGQAFADEILERTYESAQQRSGRELKSGSRQSRAPQLIRHPDKYSFLCLKLIPSLRAELLMLFAVHRAA